MIDHIASMIMFLGFAQAPTHAAWLLSLLDLSEAIAKLAEHVQSFHNAEFFHGQRHETTVINLLSRNEAGREWLCTFECCEFAESIHAMSKGIVYSAVKPTCGVSCISLPCRRA